MEAVNVALVGIGGWAGKTADAIMRNFENSYAQTLASGVYFVLMRVNNIVVNRNSPYKIVWIN